MLRAPRRASDRQFMGRAADVTGVRTCRCGPLSCGCWRC